MLVMVLQYLSTSPHNFFSFIGLTVTADFSHKLNISMVTLYDITLYLMMQSFPKFDLAGIKITQHYTTPLEFAKKFPIACTCIFDNQILSLISSFPNYFNLLLITSWIKIIILEWNDCRYVHYIDLLTYYTGSSH